MNVDRLAKRLHDAYAAAGFEVDRPHNAEHFFCVKSDSDNADIMPFISMRCAPSGVLVLGTAHIADICGKHGCDEHDLAFAMSMAAPEIAKDGVTIEIKEGMLAIHAFIRVGFLNTMKAIYAGTYDAMIDVRVALSLIEQGIKTCQLR